MVTFLSALTVEGPLQTQHRSAPQHQSQLWYALSLPGACSIFEELAHLNTPLLPSVSKLKNRRSMHTCFLLRSVWCAGLGCGPFLRSSAGSCRGYAVLSERDQGEFGITCLLSSFYSSQS